MKAVIRCVYPAVLGAVILAGCGQPNAETASAPPTDAPAPAATSPAETTPAKAPPVTVSGAKAIKVGDKAVCAVCAVKEGSTTPEEVKAVLPYKGKTYAFCNLEEKAEFITSPAKFAK